MLMYALSSTELNFNLNAAIKKLSINALRA